MLKNLLNKLINLAGHKFAKYVLAVWCFWTGKFWFSDEIGSLDRDSHRRRELLQASLHKELGKPILKDSIATR